MNSSELAQKMLAWEQLMDQAAELESEIVDCLYSGVAFTLSSQQLAAALKLFKCDGDLGELSEAIKDQLLKKISK